MVSRPVLLSLANFKQDDHFKILEAPLSFKTDPAANLIQHRHRSEKANIDMGSRL